MCFQEGAVRVAVNFGSKEVFARLLVGGYVEGGCVTGVFGKAYILAVNPEVKEGVNAIEMEYYAAPVPLWRAGESTPVGAYFVAVVVGSPVRRRGTHNASAPVALGYFVGKNNGLVTVYGGAIF